MKITTGIIEQLNEVWLATEDFQNLLIFLCGEVVLFNNSFRDFHDIKDSKINFPSVPQSNSSETLSGCGIIPITFPFLFEMPAIFRREPLGFATYSKIICLLS